MSSSDEHSLRHRRAPPLTYAISPQSVLPPSLLLRAPDPPSLPPSAQSHDKSDWVKYTMYNAPFMGLAGFLGGVQQAFYVFEVCGLMAGGL